MAPMFTQKPVIRQEQGGKKLLFECKLNASPEPSITWFRETTQIQPGGKSLEQENGPQQVWINFMLFRVIDNWNQVAQ